MKKCKKCNENKSLDEFYKSKNSKDGREGLCKSCRRSSRKKHTIICKGCNKSFKSAKKNSVYCSSSCLSNSRRKRVKANCDNCSSEIEVVESLFKKNEYNYCDQKCRTSHLRVLMSGENNPNYSSVEINCSGCGKKTTALPFQLKSQKHIFCSNDCYKENIGRFFKGEDNPNFKRVTKTCYGCGRDVVRKPSQFRSDRVFCSKDCYHKNGRVTNKIAVNCSVCDKEIRVWGSRLKYSKDIHCSKECADRGNSIRYSGEDSPHWDSDKTSEERAVERKYPAYNTWRFEVFERDSFTCQKCGDDKGGNLVAHHIYNYSEHKELRTELTNGITFCECCHKEFHDTYGYRRNNQEQINDFLFN